MRLLRLFPFALALLCLLSCTEARKSSEPGGLIKFGKQELKVGNVYRHYPLHRVVFQYRNDGDKPLVIHEVTPFCGCVTASFTRKPVLPGELGYITLLYDGSKKHDGMFSETVEVISSSQPEPRSYLNISGYLVTYQ